ncbi:MAG: peptidyl-prolyl cis-trans isomerase [Proteobacteria bacterium]|nr:peptidyl-prolyl cis-trans isomerase [Pseudomonadota bacterium]
MPKFLHLARRWRREPLIYFLAVSLVLFAVDGWRANGADAGSEIVIGANYIESLIEQYRKRVGRAPSGEEIEAIVMRHAEEEALVRYGQSLGLHSGDPIVRRRVLQKVHFMAEALATADEPPEDELADYLLTHAQVYQRPPQLRVDHIYFDTNAADDARIQAARSALAAGADPKTLGTTLPMGRRLGWRSPSDLDHLMGAGFADALADIPTGTWSDPIASRYGQHLVLVQARQSERVPELDEIRARVRQDVIAERREKARRTLIDKVLGDYQVQIDWPEASRPDAVVMREVQP